MKVLFGRFRAPALALLILQAIVIFFILVTLAGGSGTVFRSLYDFFAGAPGFSAVFFFINDHADIISTVVVVLILVMALITFRKQRRVQTLKRVHRWSRNAVVTLAQYRQDSFQAVVHSDESFRELAGLLGRLKVNSRTLSSAAGLLGGAVAVKLRETASTMQSVEEKARNQDGSAFGELEKLQQDMADLMIAAFEAMD